MDFGLSTRTLGSLQEIFKHHPKVDKVVIYGSRAMGTHKEGSDIDLTMQGDQLSFLDLARISGEIADSSIPNEVDLSLFSELENLKLLDHIERVGLVFYDKRRG